MLARLRKRLFDSARLLDFLRYSRNMSGMLPFDPQEFGLPVLINNRLAADRAASGEAIELSDIIEFLAACRSLYDLATLSAREMTKVRDCRELWASMRDQFAGMARAWEGVPARGELTSVHRAELDRLKNLCEDRAKMFLVTTKERLRYAKNRGSMIETTQQRGHQEPEPEPWRGKAFSREKHPLTSK